VAAAFKWNIGLGTRGGVVVWWLCYLAFAGLFVYWHVSSNYSSRIEALQVAWVQFISKMWFASGVLLLPHYFLWVMWKADDHGSICRD
jgi:hypothetical protein